MKAIAAAIVVFSLVVAALGAGYLIENRHHEPRCVPGVTTYGGHWKGTSNTWVCPDGREIPNAG